MTIAIRHADQRDLPAIAAIHVDCWRETYRGILSDDLLQALDPRDREAHWRAAMREGAGFRDILVAEERGRLIGFASGGLAWDADLGVEAEVEAIYVRKRDQLRGAGTALMGTMAQSMAGHGLRSAGLWVARGNIAAISFCLTLGGRIAGSGPRAIGGAAVPSVALVWSDLRRLAAHDEAAWDVPMQPPMPGLPRKPAADGARWRAAAARPIHPDAVRQA